VRYVEGREKRQKDKGSSISLFWRTG